MKRDLIEVTKVTMRRAIFLPYIIDGKYLKYSTIPLNVIEVGQLERGKVWSNTFFVVICIHCRDKNQHL